MAKPGKWEDIRKYGLILTIAILYAIFATTLIDAILTEPDYSKGCYYDTPKVVGPETRCDTPYNTTFERQCQATGGVVMPIYNNSACPTSYECSMCQKEFNNIQQRYQLKVFLLSAVLAGISILAGLMLPYRKNILNEWIGSGLIFGGLFTLFVGTMRSFGNIGEVYRPIVIFLELVLVIFLAYKMYGRSK